ncbi:PqqD family protein [Pseudolactococcus plantarum]|uniref:Coenzyme PQQ synthesis protein D (PqqD) n=1 Tax=Pseudolactococcus plantarum TaxID=1365 RepID=A0A2A5RYD9_9LACT|nr:PqqD family protein [Lactococcus plantarum]PCS06249.1 Coenzyme PQQ synthesis protein D (PqqD) [Lactococcus plantarum]HCN74756.1 PqqD family protein [Lactococcus sp.]
MNKRKKKLKIINQDEGAMVLDKSRGIYFQVNATGVLMLEGLSKGMTVKELALELEKTFFLDKKQAEIDVNQFMDLLKEMKLA